MSVISSTSSTNAVKLSLCAQLISLLTDFGDKGQLPGPINRHQQSVTATGGPQPAEPSPQADAVAENYYAYLPLFVP